MTRKRTKLVERDCSGDALGGCRDSATRSSPIGDADDHAAPKEGFKRCHHTPAFRALSLAAKCNQPEFWINVIHGPADCVPGTLLYLRVFYTGPTASADPPLLIFSSRGGQRCTQYRLDLLKRDDDALLHGWERRQVFC